MTLSTRPTFSTWTTKAGANSTTALTPSAPSCTARSCSKTVTCSNSSRPSTSSSNASRSSGRYPPSTQRRLSETRCVLLVPIAGDGHRKQAGLRHLQPLVVHVAAIARIPLLEVEVALPHAVASVVVLERFVRAVVDPFLRMRVRDTGMEVNRGIGSGHAQAGAAALIEDLVEIVRRVPPQVADVRRGALADRHKVHGASAAVP